MTNHEALDMAARILIAAYFLISAVYAVTPAERKHHVQMLGIFHVPFPAPAFWIGIVVMTVGGVLLAIGWQMEVGVWCLIVFTVVSNLLYNRYWKAQDPMQRKFKQLLFYADFAVLGGLLLVLRDLP
jgi:uncharacterized membrane protein YphA (DoxX/SURF4 family)